MTTRIIFSPKISASTQLYSFDFSSQLAVGETLTSAVVTAAVYSGEDASPSSILDGSAAVSGRNIEQLVTNGVLGVIYDLLCTAATSEGQSLTQSAYLAVVPSVP